MPKLKSITELMDEKKQLSARSKEVIEKAKTEKRQLSAEENELLGANQIRMQEINLEIEERKDENSHEGKQHEPTKKAFSLARSIRNMVNGRAQDESDAVILNAAAEKHSKSVATEKDERSIVIPVSVEKRTAFTAGAESTTGVVIDQDQQEMLLPLQNALVLAKAGARFMTGLQGDIYWPTFSGANVNWEGENDEAKDGAGKFAKGKVFKPLRLTAYVDISKQLLIQENQSVEAYIRQAIATAIAQKLETTAFDKQKDQPNTPDGMFDTTLLDKTIKGELNWANVVAMETNADIKNALYGNLAYIMNPALIGKAKTKVKDASGAGGFIFTGNGDGMLNGYKALRTNSIPSKIGDGSDEFGIAFGNWADYFIGQWGGIELMVDPYTQATKGMVRLIVNSYWNMGFIRNESFCIASMK